MSLYPDFTRVYPNLNTANESILTRWILFRGREVVVQTQTEADLDPLGLVAKAGVWYLVARTDGSIRTYKVAKVLDVAALGDGFTPPPGFDLARHWQSELERFEAGLLRGQATLRVSAAALPRIELLGAAAASIVLAATADADGWRQAVVPIESAGHAAGVLLGFVDDVEVLAPPELRAELARRARRALGLYNRDRSDEGEVPTACG